MYVYGARLKGGPQVACMLQARPGRSVKKQQQQTSADLGPTFWPSSVLSTFREGGGMRTFPISAEDISGLPTYLITSAHRTTTLMKGSHVLFLYALYLWLTRQHRLGCTASYSPSVVPFVLSKHLVRVEVFYRPPPDIGNGPISIKTRQVTANSTNE